MSPLTKKEIDNILQMMVWESTKPQYILKSIKRQRDIDLGMEIADVIRENTPDYNVFDEIIDEIHKFKEKYGKQPTKVVLKPLIYVKLKKDIGTMIWSIKVTNNMSGLEPHGKIYNVPIKINPNAKKDIEVV